MRPHKLLLLGFLLLSGCATTSTPTSLKYPTPIVGMTREQALRVYGTPEKLTAMANGEVWFYWLNKALVANPFDFNKDPKILRLSFGPDGTVYDYRMDQ